jgi:hypothetical protein
MSGALDRSSFCIVERGLAATQDPTKMSVEQLLNKAEVFKGEKNE